MIQTWEVRDWAAVLALVLSVVNTAWLAVKEFRGRRRLSVTVVTTTSGAQQPDGSILNQYFPNVTVRAITGPVGIDEVHLAWSSQDIRADLHTGPADDLPRFGGPLDERRDWFPMSMHRVLETGQRADWTFRVASTQIQEGNLSLVAVVTLTDGKQQRSAPFLVPAKPIVVWPK